MRQVYLAAAHHLLSPISRLLIWGEIPLWLWALVNWENWLKAGAYTVPVVTIGLNFWRALKPDFWPMRASGDTVQHDLHKNLISHWSDHCKVIKKSVDRIDTCCAMELIFMASTSIPVGLTTGQIFVTFLLLYLLTQLSRSWSPKLPQCSSS